MPARTLLAAALAGLAAAAPAPAPAAAAPPRPLPLGSAGLSEERSTRVLAPGVRLTRIERGAPPERAAWIVDVAVVARRAEARAAARRVRAAGAVPRTEVVAGSPYDDAPGRAGLLVRTGAFASEAEALAERDRLAAAGLTGLRVVHTSEDGRPTTGPWVVHVLAVDRAVLRAGRADGVLATGLVPGREPLSALAARTGALAAVNGGFFVVGEADGTPGDLAGASVLDGEPVSEAVDGRTSLLLDDAAGARVAAVSDRLTAAAGDGARREVDGLNRTPGLVRGCGGTGDTPTERPKHDATCTDEGELIAFRPVFGAATPAGDGAEVVLDAGGTVVEARPRGGPLPPGGTVLAGTGDAAAWLAEHAGPGTTVELAEELRAGGAPLVPGPSLDLVNGGPRLLRGGRPDVTAVAEGFAWPEDPGFLYRFGLRRNPRTIAGVTGAGTLLLVAIDGRRPGVSVGATFEESARVLRALGARDGVNLDGGGSTTLTVGGEVVNLPSDPTGERPIADAVVLTG